MSFKLAIMILMSTIMFVFGQHNIGHLQQLYLSDNMTKLKTEVQKLSVSSSDYDALFFKTLFNEDAKIAEENYKKVFEKASPNIKVLAAKKLMDYFYAIGYYVTATKYQKYYVEHKPQQPIEENHPVVQNIPASVEYFIQVGAFGLMENAQQHVKFLSTQDVKAEVVEREVSAKKLFCVWIHGKKDLDETLEYANKIKSKFDLEFQIMKK